ncbi:transcription factor GATA-3 [Trichinella spiralis]|uniref:transcription factor GATA-3 n=1 Tax=Trichinella spiralis TaxID=6334 RepID=UPI0001EFB8A7|nr:transcription factor GATA-3 [Trichinella spiralis]
MPLLFPRFRSALRFSFSSLSAGLSTPHLYIADVTPSQLSNCPSPTVAVLSSRGSDVTYSSAKMNAAHRPLTYMASGPCLGEGHHTTISAVKFR